ncbi:helix-turn-helix domain-containing protein [uncultured Enterovirga sp.]|uniref:helix-turn-helix domain-containing protein n=1 Tax=uncultured Enterovirga sp. TaxID=2026352 RepID=UPI0035CAD029
MPMGRVFEAHLARERDADHIGERLKQVREGAGVTQTQLADRLGMHQSSLSRIERQADLLVSTLRNYLEGLGAKLRIDARFEDAALRISSFAEFSFDKEEVSEDQLVLPIIGDDRFPARRDVVLSIRPQYAEPILKGRKTIELRRRFPVDVPAGTAAFIYTSSPTRALTGVAEIESVTKQSPDAIWRAFAPDACINRNDFDAYFAGLDHGYAIRLARARALRRPVELAELRDRFSFEPPQSFLYANRQLRQVLSYEFSELPH